MDFSILQTPIGAFRLVQEGSCLTRCTYLGDAPTVPAQTPLLHQAEQELVEYFAGARHQFTVPLQPQVTPFRARVLAALAAVPYGQTCTYGDLARAVGSPGASRAVGSAMRTNPLAIFLPCHRVLPASGGPGHYSAGGSGRKEYLLRLEQSVTNR